MQRSQIKRAYCESCEKETKFERAVTAMGCGDLFLTVCTLGLWVIVRQLFKPAFRCSECGEKG